VGVVLDDGFLVRVDVCVIWPKRGAELFQEQDLLLHKIKCTVFKVRI